MGAGQTTVLTESVGKCAPRLHMDVEPITVDVEANGHG
jgi:hypothetical protein